MKLLKKQKFYQLLIILVWIIFLSYVLITGKLQIFINKRFFPFSLLGLIILFVLFVIKCKRFTKEGDEPINIQTSISFFIFILPVLLALIVRPGTLPGLTASKRGISTEFTGSSDVMQLLQAQAEMEGNYQKLNLKQLLTLINKKPEKIDGKAISVEGFVFKQGDQKSFILIRYLITCCAADATPLGIIVSYNNTEQLLPDTWVKVYGKLNIENEENFIIADEVKEAQQPSNVYLY